MKQTAVEWLKQKTSDNIIKNRLNNQLSQWQDGYNVALEDVIKLLNQALELEKQQIIDSFETAFVEAYKNKIIGVATDNRGQYRRFNSAGQYYFETYKNETE